MQLIVIGLFVLIGLLIYAIYYYRHSGDESRERRRRTESHEKDDDGKVLYFPTDNVEHEKHKRNID